MEITNIRVKKIDSPGKIKAVATITLDDEFMIHDVKVIESNRGYFIAMPSRRTQAGEFKDIAHPLNQDTRKEIQDLVLSKFTLANIIGNE